MPARPFGRSLADFGELSDLEKRLLADCRLGKTCKIAKERPTAKLPENIIPAGFLRFLILGGDDDNPVHEHGVRVQAAWIDGTLDLEGVASTSDVWALSCWFDEAPVLRDAHIKGTLILSGSRIPGLKGDRLTCDAGLFCRDELLSDGEVRLLGAEIGGDLYCQGAVFNGVFDASGLRGTALEASSIEVRGSAFLNEAFTANGMVRLVGAEIGGNLECIGATFNGRSKNEEAAGTALSADGINVKGDVFVHDGFVSHGEVRLLSAVIGGDLICQNATFNTGAGYSLSAAAMSVAGTFYFRSLKAPADKVNLVHARVRVFADDDSAWGNNLDLDGFTYERIGGPSPKDAETRLNWLDKQSPEWSGLNRETKQFRPQPWLQLRKVLTEAGHAEDARKVGIAFEDRRRYCGQIVRVAKGFHWLYGFFTGYGYRPLRLLYWSLGAWLACAALYDYGAYRNKFTPAISSIYEDPSCRAVAVAPKGAPPVNQVFEPPCNGNYTTFSPVMYSLNVFLPIVQLGQEAAWAPATKPFSPIWWQNLIRPFTEPASFLQLVIWVETLFGWIAGLLLVAVVSGLARKQDES